MKSLFLTAAIFFSLASPAFALSCTEPSFERATKSATNIFKGRVIKVERRFEGDGVINDAGSHFEKATVKVETIYKGEFLAPEQEVNVIMHVWMPLDSAATDWVETETDQQKGLFAFAESDDKTKAMAGGGTAPVYAIGMCDPLVWEASPENLALIELSIAQ
jgi:hypothetical protein